MPAIGPTTSRKAAARRPVRHLPRRPVPAVGRLCRGQAARGRRLRRRGAGGADLLRPARLQLRRQGRRRSELARQTIAAFEGYDYVVAPSGSCAGMLKPHYPELLADDPAGRRAPRRSPPRCTSSSRFLVDVRGVTAVDARFDGTRHLSRQLLGPARARRPRAAAPAAAARSRAWSSSSWPTPTCAAASAAPSRVKYPDISNAIVEQQDRARSPRPAPSMLLAGDLGCLMNMAGKLSRAGPQDRRAPRRRGAGRHELSDPPIGEAGHERRSPRPPSRRTRARRSPTRSCSGRWPSVRAGLRRQARRRASPALPEFEALRDARPRHQGPHAGPPRSLSRGVREEGHARPAARVHFAADRRGRPRDHPARSAATPARASSPRASR